MTNDLADLDVFYGDLTPAQAHVYARLPRPEDASDLTLVGQVRGPRCKLAETLPVTSPLIDLGPGPTLLAQALLPDPVFWSPDLPAIYDATVNLLRGTEIIATAQRQIGLRSLGVRGRNLFLNGKRWVLRGVMIGSAASATAEGWHAANAVYITTSPHDESLAQASQAGAMAVVEIPREHAGLQELRHLSRQPAVAVALLQRELPTAFRRTEIAPNILLAQQISPSDELLRQPWADLLFAETDDPQRLARIAALGDLPIIAVRPLANPLPIDQARAACDTLQRDLAPLGQFAGYVV